MSIRIPKSKMYIKRDDGTYKKLTYVEIDPDKSLDKPEEQEIWELKEKVHDVEIDSNISKARIDNLVTYIGDDSPTNIDRELIDIRVALDGTVYNSAGNSVREQFRQLKTQLLLDEGIIDAILNNIYNDAPLPRTYYLICYVGGEGATTDSGLPMDYQRVDFDTPFTLSKNLYKNNGKEFLGWSVSPLAEEPSYTNEQEITVNLTEVSNDTVYLYAIWGEAKTYNVAYIGNGGRTSSGQTTVTHTYQKETAASAAQNTFIYDNYSFLGWGKTNSQSENLISPGTILDTSSGLDITLYAIWKKTKAIITFYANDGTENRKYQTVNVDESIALDANTFTYDTKKFIGWSTTPTGEVEYVDRANATFSNDIVLYAIWKDVLEDLVIKDWTEDAPYYGACRFLNLTAAQQMMRCQAIAEPDLDELTFEEIDSTGLAIVAALDYKDEYRNYEYLEIVLHPISNAEAQRDDHYNGQYIYLCQVNKGSEEVYPIDRKLISSGQAWICSKDHPAGFLENPAFMTVKIKIASFLRDGKIKFALLMRGGSADTNIQLFLSKLTLSNVEPDDGYQTERFTEDGDKIVEISDEVAVLSQGDDHFKGMITPTVYHYWSKPDYADETTINFRNAENYKYCKVEAKWTSCAYGSGTESNGLYVTPYINGNAVDQIIFGSQSVGSQSGLTNLSHSPEFNEIQTFYIDIENIEDIKFRFNQTTTGSVITGDPATIIYVTKITLTNVKPETTLEEGN